MKILYKQKKVNSLNTLIANELRTYLDEYLKHTLFYTLNYSSIIFFNLLINSYKDNFYSKYINFERNNL